MKNFCTTLCAGLLLFLATTTAAQVPKLSSYPSASAVIFLDFDGHTVEGTSWNGDGPIVCNGSNLDATQITEVFNRVAEDYRPFNINITTDSAAYWAAPSTQRTRVLLTTTSSWYGSAGGVAYNNSFVWGDNTPCFVFTALLRYNVKNIAEAASHEAAHTLSLNHQSSYDNICRKTAEYNQGIGSGAIGWAPIMGVGYYRNQTLWHYGTNPWGCDYMQDDLAMITRDANGFGFRADDHGNTAADATIAAFSDNKFTVKGVIETPNDSDVVRFTLAHKSRFQLTALPFSVAPGDVGADLDLQVELMNGSLKKSAVYNPPTTLSASIDTVLDAGMYYLRVKGTGNEFAPDFASLGSYTLNANVERIALPVNKLQLVASALNYYHKLDWEIKAEPVVENQAVEVSTDGINFQLLADVAPGARTFTCLPAKGGQFYYRVKIIFDDGRQFYTNTASLESNSTNRPILISNVVTSRLAVKSPAGFAYTILDLSGRTLAKGQLTQGINNISIDAVINGAYLLRCTNNQLQYTEKFLKQ